MRIFAFLLILFCNQANSMHHNQDIIEIIDPWIRKTQPSVATTTFYFQVKNISKHTDFLIGVTSQISNKINIQKSVNINNKIQSVIVSNVAIPANTIINFSPMGINIIIHDITRALIAGQQLEFILIFKNAGEKKINAIVR